MKVFTLTFYVRAPDGVIKTEVITAEPASAGTRHASRDGSAGAVLPGR